MRVVVRGIVQGVGFRPFVYRLASELELTGWVRNGAEGVTIEAEGRSDHLDEFIARLQSDRPPSAQIDEVECSAIAPGSDASFTIQPSLHEGSKTAVVLPDLATCAACLEDIRSPSNRRYRYAFTNCTHCGPRFSLMLGIPYDRATTTMRRFRMCENCQREYEDPNDRRFHAQPNACPECGPELELLDRGGGVLARGFRAIEETARALLDGRIVAAKGIGGFQLLVRASDGQAVERLRARKHREEKPFALMVPSLEHAASLCELDPVGTRLLSSIEAPIVLLRRKSTTPEIATAVAPRNPNLGVMLPYSPMHHLLFEVIHEPLVATSGNLSDEPICTDELEARDRLEEIADLFLVHDRPIARPLDDSVVRVIGGRMMMLRRARGYAPTPFALSTSNTPSGILALGAHQKNTVALTVGDVAFGGAHVGDLDTQESRRAFDGASKDLVRLYETAPRIVACDLHPDYHSTRRAPDHGCTIERVQHHYAHVRSAMLDHDLRGTVLGVAFDGTGLGTDGKIWGGELIAVVDRKGRVTDGGEAVHGRDESGSVLRIDERVSTRDQNDAENGGGTHEGWRRLGHLREFTLPGGEAAAREPWRCALGVLYEIFGPSTVDLPFWREICPLSPTAERGLLRAIARSINAPRTTSVGRLFDAVSGLLGLCQRSTFEGQAPMLLEFASIDVEGEPYPMPVEVDPSSQMLVLDWGPTIRAVLSDRGEKRAIGEISAAFHGALANAVAESARRIGVDRVVLTGGCFQNQRLLERTTAALRRLGHIPYWPHRIPPNDGGIALGQAAAVADGIERSAALARP